MRVKPFGKRVDLFARDLAVLDDTLANSDKFTGIVVCHSSSPQCDPGLAIESRGNGTGQVTL